MQGRGEGVALQWNSLPFQEGVITRLATLCYKSWVKLELCGWPVGKLEIYLLSSG